MARGVFPLWIHINVQKKSAFMSPFSLDFTGNTITLSSPLKNGWGFDSGSVHAFIPGPVVCIFTTATVAPPPTSGLCSMLTIHPRVYLRDESTAHQFLRPCITFRTKSRLPTLVCPIVPRHSSFGLSACGSRNRSVSRCLCWGRPHTSHFLNKELRQDLKLKHGLGSYCERLPPSFDCDAVKHKLCRSERGRGQNLPPLYSTFLLALKKFQLL